MGLTQKLGTIPLAIFTDASNNIGIGGSPSGSYKFEVTGTGRFTGNVNIDGERLTIGGTSNNAIINNIASVRVNIDCDNTGTGESFTIGHNQVGIDNNNVLFRVQDNANTGIGTSDIVSTNLTGALTIKKSYNGDSTNGATTQSYYANQSALFLFGRNSGLTIVSNNNEEGSIIFGNNSTNAYASIVTGSGGSATGGDMYFRVGSNTERMRIRTNGNKTFNGPGGQDQMFSAYARLSNGEYVDIDTESGGGNFQGFLIIANSYAYNAGYRSQGTFSAIGRGTTFSLTTIASVNGPTGSSGFSVTAPSTGIIRVTNTGLYGDLIVSWRGFV